MTMAKHPHQICTFKLGDTLFGVDVTNVQEVIRYQEMTSVPLAPAIIRGLINLRGQIVTAIDMRACLGLPPHAEQLPMNVVVRTGDGVASLLVDEIGDVLQPDESCFERVPETIVGVLRELVTGVYKLDHSLLLLLDVERLMSSIPMGHQTEAA